MNVATIAVAAAAILILPSAPRAGSLEPSFDSIQANVFTPSCAQDFCHGAGMSASLDLRAGNSYANLVNVPSVEFPVWDLVEPGNPDQSWLICKLEACPEMVGQPMPIIGGPLDQTVIDVIREWILDGAHPGGSIAVEATSWGKVKAIYR